eukprot:TRINITY_DN10058_c0_g1_i1.p1 TRINITY_DN10058_c0_g1~~TRINITY_DN10058_c0_g1_i1.p1  ORF type:complete len:227 (-),score=102.19 TRINITY_DN10058_c0_g1_i1:56-703(-)
MGNKGTKAKGDASPSINFSQVLTQNDEGTGLNLNTEDLRTLFKTFDKDKSGKLDFNEARAFFTHVISNLREQGAWPFEGCEEDAISEAFFRLDSDGSGKISFEEFSNANFVLWTQDQEKVWRVSAAFDIIDRDRSRSIDRDELARWMRVAIGEDKISQKVQVGDEQLTILDLTFRNVDLDGSGTISKEEFVNYFARPDGPNLATVVAMCEAAKKV